MKKILFIFSKSIIWIISITSFILFIVAFCVTFHIGTNYLASFQKLLPRSVQQQLSQIPILNAAFKDIQGINGIATMESTPVVFPANTTFNKDTNVLGTLQVGKDIVVGGKGNFIKDININKDAAIGGGLQVNGNLVVGGNTTFTQGLNLSGNNLNLGTGSLTAANVLYGLTQGNGITIGTGQNPTIANSGVLSLQSQTGNLSFTAGSGIYINGLTITNTDLGSSQNIFKNIAVSGQSTLTAGSNNDTLNFTAGSGITLATSGNPNTLTISASSSALNVSGWTHVSNNTYVTNTTDNVGIGTTNPTASLDVAGTASISGNLTFRGGGGANSIQILNGQPFYITTSPGGDAGLTTNVLSVVNNTVTIPNLSMTRLQSGNINSAYNGQFTIPANGNGTGLLIGGTTTSNSGLYAVSVDENTAPTVLKINGSGSFATVYLSGNVGIGTTTPGSPLDVTGAINTSSAYNIGGSSILSLPGTSNLALGTSALHSITTGTYNVAVGTGSLGVTTTGGDNTALGYNTLELNTSGNDNTALGNSAMYSNTTGVQNTAVAYGSLFNNTTGNNNSALGLNSLHDNTTGGANTAIGEDALFYNTTSNYNTAVGYESLLNSTGYNNTAVGELALVDNTTGNYNTAVGSLALNDNASASANTALGYAALYYNTTGNNNTGLGEAALYQNSTGTYNTGVGGGALYTNTTGINNTGVGADALYQNTTGSDNNAIGVIALTNNTTGGANTAVGYESLSSNTTGSNNTAFGELALPDNTTAYYNTAIGRGALFDTTTGGDNTALGYGAGLTLVSANANTTGSNNTFIGYNAGPGTSTQLTNAGAIGSFATVSQNNSLVLGSINGINGATASTGVGIGTQTPIGALDVEGAFAGQALMTLNYTGTDQNIFTASVSGSTKFVIDHSGNVGIGTTTPGYTLDLQSSTAATAAAEIYNTNTGVNADGLALKLGFTGNGTVPTSQTAGNSFERFLNGNGIAQGSIDTNGLGGVTYNTTGIDYAEYFTKASGTSFEAGDVVSLGGTDTQMATKATRAYDSKLLGIVSAHPGFTGGTPGANKVLVGLTGQLPVKVSTENGVIQAGDLLTSSNNLPGVAMKATRAGQIIAKALESYSGQGIGEIQAYVSATYADPTAPTIALTSTGDLSVNGQVVGTTQTPTNGLTINNALSTTPQPVQTGTGVTLDQFNGLSTTVSGLQSQIASMSSQLGKIDDLSKQLADLQKTVNLNQLLSGTSTQSAVLGASITNEDQTIGGKLNVLGRTLLTDVGITGKVTMGLLTIDGTGEDIATPAASINTLSGPLKLQSLALGGLDILNGKVTIDTNGNVQIAESITAKKYNVSTKDTLSASAGKAEIPAGKTFIDIHTSALTHDSLIFATPIATPSAVSTSLIGTDTFEIRMKEPLSQNLDVSWWIIN